MTPLDERRLRGLAAGAGTREDLWVALVNDAGVRDVAEIGVYRGDFAARLLRDCPGIASYTLVDPWRHLDGWNKPANRPDDVFAELHREAMEQTEPWAAKRVVLRGTTTEVSDELADESLDLAYVDGDHTLRGITVDLVRIYPKVRDGGWIGGDDFRASIWHHGERFEPTLVFPFAVHFAEAVGARIWGLPRSQFLLEKRRGGSFELVDLTGRYGELELGRHAAPRPGS